LSYTFTATEAGYSGKLTATATNPHDATVTPGSVANGGTFTVNSQNQPVFAGFANIIVSDSHGNTVTETVRLVTCLG
jgi:hypothetical protein